MMELLEHDPNINIFNCDVTNVFHLWNLVIAKADDHSLEDQIQFFAAADHTTRLQDVVTAYSNTKLRMLYIKLCMKAEVQANPSSSHWGREHIVLVDLSLRLSRITGQN